MNKKTTVKTVGATISLLLFLFTFSSPLSAQEESESFRAFLSGANEVSPVFTTGSGLVEAELNEDELTITGSFEGLVAPLEPVGGTGAHIHLGFAGQNGGVEIPLDPELSDGDHAGTFDQTVTLETEQLEYLQQRRLYINIHSERYPSGELRGQLLPADKTYYQAYASGGYEVPSNTSRAQGGIAVEWDDNDLVVTGSFSDLGSDYIEEVGETGSGAHLHVGMAGNNGGVELPLTVTVNEDGRSGHLLAEDNTFEDPSSDITDLLGNRELYLNIHTENYPGGEIRGQVVPEANHYYYALLSGTNEIPQNTSQARGAVIVEWYSDDGSITASGSFDGLASDFNGDIGSHIHAAMAGVNGGIEIHFAPEIEDDLRGGHFNPGDHEFNLDEDQQDLLENRSLYVNVHTQEHGAGEIRGQLMPLAQLYFTASLTGITEVEPVMTEGQGGLAFEFRNGELTATGSFSGLGSNYLESPGSHIHNAAAGENAGVIHPLSPEPGDEEDARSGTYHAEENIYGFSEDEIEQLLAGELYVNVHSEENPPGEIRGQILLAPNVAPDPAPEITFPEDGAELTVEGDSADLLEPEWASSTDADEDRIVYVWQLALDADFEEIIHSASAGEDTTSSLSYGEIDEILDEQAVEEGGTLDLWHRAVATDGSGIHAGEGTAITFERGMVTSTQEFNDVPKEVSLDQNYPNPFNPATNITYTLPEQRDVQLKVFDMLGREIATLVDEAQTAGSHTITFDASSLSSGMYLYRMEAGDRTITRKMMLIK